MKHVLVCALICALSCVAFADAPVVFTLDAKSTDIADQLTYPARVDSRVNAKLISEIDGVVLRIVSPIGSRIGRNQPVLLVKHIEPGYTYAPVRVTSPVNGVVSQLKVTEGSQIVRGEELAAVIDPSALRILIEVSAADISSIKPGLRGEFLVPGNPVAIPVAAVGVSPFVDPATGTATCELKVVREKPLEAAAPFLAPGLIGQAKFKVNSRKGFMLPDHAIVHRGNDTEVRIVVDDKAQNIPVKLGRKNQGMVEILNGLKEGQQVIERTSQFVANGAKVKVEKQQGKAM